MVSRKLARAGFSAGRQKQGGIMKINKTYEILLKNIKKERALLERQQHDIDEMIKGDVEEFEKDLLAAGFSPKELSDAKEIYIKKQKKRILSDIQSRLKDLPELESHLKCEIRNNLRRFTREGLSFIYSS